MLFAQHVPDLVVNIIWPFPFLWITAAAFSICSFVQPEPSRPEYLISQALISLSSHFSKGRSSNLVCLNSFGCATIEAESFFRDGAADVNQGDQLDVATVSGDLRQPVDQRLPERAEKPDHELLVVLPGFPGFLTRSTRPRQCSNRCKFFR